MPEIKRGLDVLSEKAREQCTKDIVAFFEEERGEEIGVIAAGDVLDFFLQSIGPDIYNKAIDDAKKTVQKQLEALDFEIDLLKKQK